MVNRIANLFRRPHRRLAEPPAGSPGPQPVSPADVELAPNPMLAKIIAGRTIAAVAQDISPASVTFVDGSIMKIKTGGPLPAEALIGKTVKNVRQGGLELELQFQDESRATISLAEETSSVLLRDGKGTFEYAD